MITGCPGIKKRKQTQRPGMLPVYNFGSLFICIVCFCPWLIGQECPFIFGPSIHIGVIVFVIHRSEPLEPDYRSTDNLQQRQSAEYFCIFIHCLEKSCLIGALGRSSSTEPPVPLSVYQQSEQALFISTQSLTMSFSTWNGVNALNGLSFTHFLAYSYFRASFFPFHLIYYILFSLDFRLFFVVKLLLH